MDALLLSSRERGVPDTDTAARLGVTVGAARSRIRRLRAEIGGSPRMGRPVAWTPERLAEFERLWRDGLTIPRIAGHFGITVTHATTVLRGLRDGGCDLPPRGVGRGAWQHPERVAELEAAWKEGRTVAELARFYGVSEATIRTIMKRLRRYGGDVARRNTPSDWTPERVAELEHLWAQGEATSAIADHFGITRGRLNNLVCSLRKTGAALPYRR